MLRWLKVLPLALALVALGILAISCTSSNNSTQARFVNAISNAGTLDIEVNGTKKFSAVAFGTASASTYTGISSGNDAIEGLAAGTSTQAFTTNLTLHSGSQYTLVAAGLLNGTVNILNPVDTNTAPANGSVNFRVINASSFGTNGDGNPVDIYILPNPNPVLPSSCSAVTTGEICISNLAYGSTSSYVTIPFNSNGSGWQMIVTLAGNPTPYFNDTLTNVGSASVGAICTLVLYDQANGNKMNTSPLPLHDLNCS